MLADMATDLELTMRFDEFVTAIVQSVGVIVVVAGAVALTVLFVAYCFAIAVDILTRHVALFRMFREFVVYRNAFSAWLEQKKREDRR